VKCDGGRLSATNANVGVANCAAVRINATSSCTALHAASVNTLKLRYFDLLWI